jgi:predicted N-acetyltransferase YhbS
MITIRQERPSDVAAREALLDIAYGDVRFIKPSERLRKGRKPADGLSFVAVEHGRIVGTVRLWPVTAGQVIPCLLLGPLAVHPDCRNRGIGAALMRRAMSAACRHSHAAVLLVGDASYYGRFGFSAEAAGPLRLPGLDNQQRLLAHEFKPGALTAARGAIHAAPHARSATRKPAVATASAAVPRAA